MKAEQKKKLEEQLRQMIARAEQPADEERPTNEKYGTARVIRRRRGQPDMLIA